MPNRMSFLEREPLAGTPSTLTRAATFNHGKAFAWAVGLGLILVADTLLLSQSDLETAAAPIHIALLGFLGTVLLSARSQGARQIELWGIVAAAAALTYLCSLTNDNGLVLGAGWLVLLAWGFRAALRGGRR